ncbi:MAG: zf-HC2 domain-containing protein [Cytophagales bacterium]|nr:zf-HC2 domain-containing protein [Cytophagales bacterium]
MKCQEIENLLFDYIEGQVATKEKAKVEEHLRQSASCCAVLEADREILSVWEGFDDANPTEKLQQDFEQMLAQEKLLLEEEKKVVPISSVKPYQWVAAAVLIFSLGFIFSEMFQRAPGKEQLSSTYILDFSSPSDQMQAIFDMEKDEKRLDEKELEVLMMTMAQAKHPNVRLAALEGIVRHYDSPKVRKFVTLALETEQDPNVQMELIQTLVDWKQTNARDAVKRFYAKETTSMELKYFARMSLGMLEQAD